MQLLYRRKGFEPSSSAPVIVALSLMVTSPTFVQACSAYERDGYFWYMPGNVAYISDGKLAAKARAIQQDGMQAEGAIMRQPLQKPAVDLSTDPAAGYGKDIFTLLRLDCGEARPFVPPPTNFAAAVLAFAQANGKQKPPAAGRTKQSEGTASDGDAFGFEDYSL